MKERVYLSGPRAALNYADRKYRIFSLGQLNIT